MKQRNIFSEFFAVFFLLFVFAAHVQAQTAPSITSSAPTTAAEDTLYSFTATANDSDGPSETWSVLGGSTCGGAFAGNVYSFTPAGPTPPATCDVAVQVCDGGTPVLCDTQTTTVSVTADNDQPAITSSAPTNAVTGVAYTYTPLDSDPDGPGVIWTVEAVDSCGGLFTAGSYSFTPAGAGSCDVAIKVCDGGSPDRCDTEGPVTVNIADSPVLIGHNYDVNGGSTLNCNTCHAFHGGTMVPTADEVYTACTQCHNSTGGGAINSDKWDVSNHTVTGESDSTLRTVDCGQCHEVHKNALLSDSSDLEPGGGIARNVAYIRVKMSKYISGALDNTVFHSAPNHFAEYNATGIGTNMNGVCQSCHTDTKFHKNTEIGSNHKMSAGGPPNITDCTACHQHGAGDEGANASGGSFAATGGHGGSNFGWGGNCDDCHSATPGNPNETVVTDIHGDKCDLCHIGGIYNDTSNGAGPVANGIDGDASLAEGSAVAGFNALTYTCTTCHVIAGAVNATSIGGIHHDNNTDGVVSVDANCTTKCHNVTGHKGGHDTNIAATANCDSCHTTSGDVTGAAIVAAADVKVHDGCMVSCHDIAATPGAKGLLQAVSAPGSSGVIAAGNCNGCHNSYFVNHSHHSLASNKVVAIGNCSTCHDGSVGGSARDAISVPFVASGEVHNSTAGGDECSACHNIINGARISLASSADSATDGTAADFSCIDCHTTASTWANIHDSASGIDHSQEVASGATGCDSCHTVTGDHGLTEIASLVDGATGNKAHSFCTDCHNADGSRKAVTAPDGSSNIPAGGGDCTTCHDSRVFTDHSHHYTTANQLTYNAAIDRSQQSDTAGTACAVCHLDDSDGTGGPLSSFADILGEHLGDCNICHDYASDSSVGDDTPVLSVVNTRIATDATTSCTQCHLPKLWSNATSDHGTVDHTALGYVTFVGSVPGCDTCHIPGTIDATIGVHLTCQSCHTSSPPALRTDYGSMKYVPSIPPGGGNCEDCHYGHQVGEETGVDVAQLPAQMCGECHGGLDRKFTDFSEIKMHHYNECGTCHDSTRDINDPNDGVTPWTATGYKVADVIANGGITGLSGAPHFIPDDTVGPTNCTNCHRGRMGLDHTGHPRIKAGIRGSRYSDDAIGQQTLTCFASGCHAENTAEEHLTPRGVAYKNFKYKYNSAFDCEFCHQYKFPVQMIKDIDGCSDPSFTTKVTCDAGTPTWSTIVGECSDPAFTNQTDCENGTPTWHEPLTFNDDPVIQAAIANGLNGNDVYCSDCHKEDVGRHDFGECSDGTTQNEIECEFSCSNVTYTTQVDCLANGGTWDVATGETWIWAGYCSDPVYENEADCTSNGGSWTQSVPYSMHNKYNGLGIYDISEWHHAAEVYTGTCSNAGLTDETACWDDSSNWTASYTPGVTYVGNGDCTACHLDPREVNNLPGPKKLPCIECHVDNDAVGNQVTVYKDRSYTQDTLASSGYTGWSWTFTGNIANTDPIGLTGTQHQWSINGGDIQNYGACVFCHKMRPYHAMTDPASSGLTWTTAGNSSDSDCSDGTCDIEHFPGVGRNGFNTFFGIWRQPTKYYVVNHGSGAKPGDNTIKGALLNVPVIDGVPKVHPVYWQKVTYDPQTDPHGQVPVDHTLGIPEYFVIPVFDTPSGAGSDSLSISTVNSSYSQSAQTLTVEASCTGTCTEVYVIWGGQEYSMGTGAGTHTKVLTSADGVPDTYPNGLPGFDTTPDTNMGRVYVISVDSNGMTTDQAAIDFKKNNVKTLVTYP